MAKTKDDTPRVRAKSANGGRLRNARIERDKPAAAQATSDHRSMCRGFFDGLFMRVNEFLSEPHNGTRMHKDDAREVKALVEELRAEAFERFRVARIQQHGIRDCSIVAPVGAIFRM